LLIIIIIIIMICTVQWCALEVILRKMSDALCMVQYGAVWGLN